VILCILLTGLLAALLVSASLPSHLSVSRSSGLCFSALLVCLFAVLRVLCFSAYFPMVY